MESWKRDVNNLKRLREAAAPPAKNREALACYCIRRSLGKRYPQIGVFVLTEFNSLAGTSERTNGSHWCQERTSYTHVGEPAPAAQT